MRILVADAVGEANAIDAELNCSDMEIRRW